MTQYFSASVFFLCFTLNAWVRAENGSSIDRQPKRQPSFWDGSQVIGFGRPEWVYYHVTNIPLKSILYCPQYPVSPNCYPEWPQRRLVRPDLVVKGGQVLMRDPQVEEAKEKEEGEKSEEKNQLWLRACRWMEEQWNRYFASESSYRTKNFLFKPVVDQTFNLSTLYRYLPPDQFWQICHSDIILVDERDPEAVRRRLIEQGEREQKLVLLVGPNPYARTVHTADFWEPWSVFCPINEENPSSAPTQVPINRMEEGLRPTVLEPDQAGQQTKRRWRIIREVDLATESYLDLLVDREGQMEAPWRLGDKGSRFEVWIMNWGSVQAKMVDCWSVLVCSSGKGQRNPPIECRISFTSEKATMASDYRINWKGIPPAGDLGIQIWSENASGDTSSGCSRFQRVARTPGWNSVAVASGDKEYALWWQPTKGQPWTLLSELQR